MKRPYDWGLLGYLGQEVEIVDEPSNPVEIDHFGRRQLKSDVRAQSASVIAKELVSPSSTVAISFKIALDTLAPDLAKCTGNWVRSLIKP